MKAVLVSIAPKWCKFIKARIKRLEIRKGTPQKSRTPFKVYIYETKGRVKRSIPRSQEGSGKIIGEFICDKVYCWQKYEPAYNDITLERISELSCVSEDDLLKYADNSPLYGWRITDLKIYDKPRELSEFRILCAEYEKENPRCGDCKYYYSESNESTGFYEGCACEGVKPIIAPPQSWCYVREAR